MTAYSGTQLAVPGVGGTWPLKVCVVHPPFKRTIEQATLLRVSETRMARPDLRSFALYLNLGGGVEGGGDCDTYNTGSFVECNSQGPGLPSDWRRI